MTPLRCYDTLSELSYHNNDGGNIFLLGDNPGLMGTRIFIRTRGKAIDAVTFTNLISPEELNGPALMERKQRAVAYC